MDSRKRNTPKRLSKKQQLITEADVMDPNSALFETLMSDPLKRALILNLISSEKASIEAYMTKEKTKAIEASKQSPVGKVKQTSVLESPTALMRRRALEKLEKAKFEQPKDNDDFSAKKADLPILPYENLLKGVRAYVEVISKNEDRSAGVKALLTSMGAIVNEEFTRDVTHVIFKDGSFSTYERARILKKHVVSVLWLDAVRNTRTRIPEKNYPALGAANYNRNVSAICEKFQNNYEDIISSERKKKFLHLDHSEDSQDSGIIPCSQNSEATSILSKTISRKSRRTMQKKHGSFVESDADSDCGIIDGVPYSKCKSLPSKSVDTPSKNKIIPKTPQPQPRNMWTPKVQKPLEVQQKTSTVIIPETNSAESVVPETPEPQPKNRRTLYKDTTSELLDQLKTKAKRKSLYASPLYMSAGKTPKRKTLAAIKHNLNSELEQVDNMKKGEDECINNKIVSRGNLSGDLKEVCYEKVKNENMAIVDMEVTNVNVESVKSRESLDSVGTNVSEEFGIFVTKRKRKARMVSEKCSFNNPNEILKNSLVEDLSYLRLSSDNSTNVSMESRKSSLSTLESIPSLKISCSSSDNNSLSLNLSSMRLSSSHEAQQDIGNIDENIKQKKTVEKSIELSMSSTESKIFNQDNEAITVNEESGDSGKLENTNNYLVIDKYTRENACVQDATTIEQKEQSITPVSINKTSKGNENADVIPAQVLENSKEININNANNLEDIKSILLNEADKKTPARKILRSRTSRLSINADSKIKPVVSRKSMRLQKKMNSLSDNIESENITDESNNQEVTKDINKNDEVINMENKSDATENMNIDKKITSAMTGDESSDSSAGLSSARTKRKLYRMNQTIDEEVRKKAEEENEKLKQQKIAIFKEPPQPVHPYILANNVQQFIQKRINELPSSDDELPIEPLKENRKEIHAKKFNESADEQKELLNDFLNTNKDVVHTNVSCDLPIKRLPRRSTMDFMPKVIKPRKVLSQFKKKTSIVCTKFHRKESLVFQEIVTKLGCFDIERDVSTKTSHLIVGECKRTINILRAIARGIWILKADWLYKSMEASKWLQEEDYELTEFSPAVQQCRIEREAFGPWYSMDIFQNCGPIYVTKGTHPKFSDLEELVVLCKGNIVTSAKNAKIIIGMASNNKNAVGLKETWILDSITFNKCKNINDYTIQPETNRKSVIV